MALTEGTKLDRYEILAPIGAGGMGEVYLARDHSLDRQVALKILPPELSRDPTRFERFRHEARAAGKLNHPNVLTIYDVGEQGGVHYLVSELLDGETLAERIASGPVPVNKAVDYAIQIASGLSAAHAEDIVHRDLKPANIVVTRDGRIKILDFGLAKKVVPVDDSETTAVQKLTEAGTVVGTPGYMSPEHIRGKSVDQRSDIFALGTVLFEMLSGQPAFRRGTAVETMSAILNEEPESGERISWPPALQSIVARCLEKSPEERFQSARDLAFHLKVLSNPSTGILSTSWARPSRRLNWKSLALALGALTGLALGLVTLYALTNPSERTIPSFTQLSFRHGWVSNARFSPDGETILYGAAWDGNSIRIFATRTDNPASRRLDLPDADLLAVSSLGELAVSLDRKESTFGASFIGTLARLPLEGQAPRELLKNAGDASWSPDGTELAAVHVVGSRYRLEYPLGTVLYESDGWISHPRVSPDGNLVAFLEHPLKGDDRGDVCFVGRDGGTRVLSSGWASVLGLAWSPSGEEVWFTASDLGPDNALRAVDLSGKARIVTRGAGRLVLLDVDNKGRVLLVSEKARIAMHHWSKETRQVRDLSWLGTSVATDISGDGKTVLFNEQGAGAGTSLYAAYVRNIDESSAIRLGDGIPTALSPDGKWALTIQLQDPPELALLPTGAGSARPLARGKIVGYQAAAWFPDGQRIVFAGNEEGRAVRLYAQEIAGGDPAPISSEIHPPSYLSLPISTDGRYVAAMDAAQRIVLYPLDGERTRSLSGLEPGDLPLRFGQDGTSLFVLGHEQPPASIYRFDLESQEKELVAELAPTDPAGAWNIIFVQTTPDASTFAYSYRRNLSDLYLVEKLK